MDLTMVRADPARERVELQEIWQQSLPDDKFFGDDVWQDPSVETYWVRVNGVRVGFTTLQLHVTVADTYDQDLPKEIGTMYILITALKPGFRGQGLGTQVKHWHIDYARGRGDIRKLVSNHRRSNTASRRFNVKSGYRQVAEKPDYYPKPLEDSIVMELKL